MLRGSPVDLDQLRRQLRSCEAERVEIDHDVALRYNTGRETWVYSFEDGLKLVCGLLADA